LENCAYFLGQNKSWQRASEEWIAKWALDGVIFATLSIQMKKWRANEMNVEGEENSRPSANAFSYKMLKGRALGPLSVPPPLAFNGSLATLP
jgi:hypothetical protein